jgi:hypothetical protein
VRVLQKLMLFLLVLSLSIVSFPLTGFACDCAETPTVDEAMDGAEVVFTGKVLEVKEEMKLNGSGMKSVLFVVKNSWKGVTQSQVNIATGFGGGDCGCEFQVGQEYLVYSAKSPFFDNHLTTSICSRTDEINTAKEDIVFLEKGKVPKEKVPKEKAPVEKVNIEGDSNRVNYYAWGMGLALVGVIVFFIYKNIDKRGKNND